MIHRITHTQLYCQMAELMAKRGTCQRLSVGAIITKDNRIIATGYNGPLKGEKHCKEHGCKLDEPCTRAVHAEANAIAFSARFGQSLNGCTMYVTHNPCKDCARLIVQAGISKVVFITKFRDEAGIEILKGKGIQVTQHEPDA